MSQVTHIPFVYTAKHIYGRIFLIIKIINHNYINQTSKQMNDVAVEIRVYHVRDKKYTISIHLIEC